MKMMVMDALTAPSKALSHAIVKWTVDAVLPRPRAVIYACVLVVLACGAGVHRIDIKSQTDELWVPQKTQIMRNRDRVSETYGSQLSQPHWHAVILSADDGNVLTPAGVNLMYDLEERMAALDQWNATCVQRKPLEVAAHQSASTSSRIPAVPEAECTYEGVTTLWCNRTHYNREVTASSNPAAALLRIINTRTRTCHGGSIERLRVFGSPTYADGSMYSSTAINITGAKYAVGWYHVDWSKGEGPAENIGKAFESLMKNQKPNGFTVEFAYSLAFASEISRSITVDIPLVATSFTLISITTVATQYLRGKPSVSFTVLSSWGMCVVLMSILMGYGLTIWCGVPFTSLAMVGPFIFMGIGVDDVIIMLESFRLARMTLPDGGTVRSRAEFAMQRAGMSISITSFTNVLAFALGSMTVIPAVQWFCIYASAAIVCDFILQMSLFLAILLLYEERDQANGVPAMAYELAATELTPLPPPTTASESARLDAFQARTLNLRNPAFTHESLLQYSIRVYADTLMQLPVRVFVILVFMGFGVFSLMSMGEIEEGLPRASLAPDDSFLQGFMTVLDTVIEAQVGTKLEHHFQGLDHSKPDSQARILAAWGIYSNVSEFITPIGSAADASNWLTATLKVGSSLGVTVPCRQLNVSTDMCALAAVPFGGAEPRLLPSAVFISTLTTTLETYPVFGQFIGQRRNASEVVTSTYINTLTVPVSDDYALRLKIFKDITRLDGLASEIFASNAAVDFESQTPRFFTFHDNLVYWQTDAVLWDELITNLSFAGVGVFIVCLLTLMHPAALIATAGVGVVDIFLFGSLYIGSIRFNVISVINFVMAVGLAVDYTLHFCHAFLATPGTDRVARVKYTIQTMGSSILKGGGTTLIGILPMAFSTSTIFRTFFALLFSTVAYALLVGMVLLPVVMSVLPMPSAPHLQHDSTDTTVTFGKTLQRLEDRLVDMEKEELEKGKSGQ